MTDPSLSGQTILMLGGVMGGVCGVILVALRLVEKVIDKRTNGNGSMQHQDYIMLHEDIREIDGDIKVCSNRMTELHRAADGFTTSHVILKELLTEMVVSNREYHTEFSIFLAQFTDHMRDFRCLGLGSQTDREE